MRDALRAELLALVGRDDATRARLAAAGTLWDGYHPEMEAVHRANAARLGEIVAALGGWPGRSAVGADGAEAAWRILQHAIGEPALVRALLPLVEAAAAAGEAAPAHVAHLVDRVRVLEGRPQRYGTQIDWDPEGALCMVPMVGVEDPEHVDTRRAAVGLPPLVWRRPPPPGEPPPADRAARARAMEDWARRVGWRRA
jgi:hypothetical protein